MNPISIRVRSHIVVAAKASLPDRVAQIMADYTRSGQSYLPPKDFEFLMRNFDEIENDEALELVRKYIKQVGLAPKFQVDFIRKEGEAAIDILPDLTPEAQEYCLRKDVNVGGLIEKIPNLETATPALLKAAIQSDTTSEVVVRFMLHRYLKEITGLNLRKAALLKYPRLVFVLPSGVDLTLAEKKELVEADPETFKAFQRKEPSLVKLYNQITQGDEPAIQEVSDDMESTDSTRLKELIDELNDARLAGDDVLVKKLTDQIAEVRNLLNDALNIEAAPEDTMKKEQKTEAEATKTVPVTRNDLTGFVAEDPTSGEAWVVLSHMQFIDISDLPEAVSQKLSGYLQTLNFQPNNYLRLRKVTAKTGQPLAHMLATDEELAALKVTKKLTNALLDGIIQGERTTGWNQVLNVVTGNFDQVTSAAPANQSQDKPQQAQPGAPEPDPMAGPLNPNATLDDGSHVGLQNLQKFVKQLVGLRRTVDKATVGG